MATGSDPGPRGALTDLGGVIQAHAASKATTLQQRIKALVEEQAAQKKARKQVLKELKNNRRKRSRLLKKTKGLSDGDLIELLRGRQANELSGGIDASEVGGDEGGASAIPAPPSPSGRCRRRRHVRRRRVRGPQLSASSCTTHVVRRRIYGSFVVAAVVVVL